MGEVAEGVFALFIRGAVVSSLALDSEGQESRAKTCKNGTGIETRGKEGR